MRYEWKNQRITPKNLSHQIEEFLDKNKFITETQEDNATFKILAIPTKKTEIKEKLEIEIRPTKDGITVDFKTIEKTQTSIKIGLLASFLTGGSLLLRSIKSKEKLEELQKKFWQHLQEYISTLQV